MSMSDNHTLEKALPTALSPSSASTFSQCPQRWKFRYIDRLPDPPGRSALLGTFAHAVLEHLFQEQPESRTKEKAKSIASALWPETDSDPDFIALGLDDQGKTAFKRDCMSAFNGVWEIDKYKPEIILISAGFDAHKRDPLANINLESEDFYEITKLIVNLANIHSKGRVISFLEGGYDLLALSESIKQHLLALKN